MKGKIELFKFLNDGFVALPSHRAPEGSNSEIVHVHTGQGGTGIQSLNRAPVFHEVGRTAMATCSGDDVCDCRVHGPHGPGPAGGQSHKDWKNTSEWVNWRPDSIKPYCGATVVFRALCKVQAEILSEELALELVEAIPKVATTAP